MAAGRRGLARQELRRALGSCDVLIRHLERVRDSELLKGNDLSAIVARIKEVEVTKGRIAVTHEQLDGNANPREHGAGRKTPAKSARKTRTRATAQKAD